MVANNYPRKKNPGLLFVCTANICRSPMAQVLFLARLKKECADWQDWQVESAGTWASEGQKASKFSQRVMAQRGLDLSRHTSRTVSADMLKRFDLVLTMEPGHKEALQVEFPDIASRVMMLSELVGKEEAVADPYGGSLEKYEEAARKIDGILEKGMPRIFALVCADSHSQ